MDNNTPGLDTPSTRILIGLLIGVVLTAGAFIGGFVAFNNGPDKPAAVANTQPKDPETVKLEVWNLAAGRAIAPVLNLLGSVQVGQERAVCTAITEGRLDALRAVAVAPNATVDELYRFWITDLEAVMAECDAGRSEEAIARQLANSGASFGAFYSAVDAIVGFSKSGEGAPSAVSRGPETPGMMPGATTTPVPKNP